MDVRERSLGGQVRTTREHREVCDGLYVWKEAFCVAAGGMNRHLVTLIDDGGNRMDGKRACGRNGLVLVVAIGCVWWWERGLETLVGMFATSMFWF